MASPTRFHGQPVAPGIGLGPAFLLRRQRRAVPRSDIPPEQVSAELDRLASAIERTRTILTRQRDRAARKLGDLVARIFDTHLMFLDDEVAFDEVRGCIRDQRVSAAYAVYATLETFAQGFEQQQDTYFRDRAQDVRDVCRRLVGQLDGDGDTELSDIPEQPIVLLAHELNPSDVLHLPQEHIIAVATDAGGATSHTAILTRTLGVPAVVGLRSITAAVRAGETVVVNGNSGKVIVNPDDTQRAEYTRKQSEYREFVRSLEDIRDQCAVSTDGREVRLAGNIEMPSEAAAVLHYGGDGVGLFRTEYLVLTHGGLPGEEQQYQAYRAVIEGLQGRPVTIRTFDLGGDKAFPGAGIPPEDNPNLGYRAIRVAFDRPEMIRPQLRAIFRASAHGPVKLMFPMISGLVELRKARALVDAARSELAAEGVPMADDVPVGMMIEVPSAALLADRFAPLVDFFSIGTNDLVQFTLAVDRSNEQVAALHQPFHPAVLRLIEMTTRAAHDAGIPVSMCGEFAGQPLATLLLLGLDVDELSTSPSLIPEVKKLILSAARDEARALAKDVLAMDTVDAVRDHLLDYMKKRFKNLPIWFDREVGG